MVELSPSVGSFLQGKITPYQRKITHQRSSKALVLQGDRALSAPFRNKIARGRLKKGSVLSFVFLVLGIALRSSPWGVLMVPGAFSALAMVFYWLGIKAEEDLTNGE